MRKEKGKSAPSESGKRGTFAYLITRTECTGASIAAGVLSPSVLSLGVLGDVPRNNIDHSGGNIEFLLLHSRALSIEPVALLSYFVHPCTSFPPSFSPLLAIRQTR